MVFEGGEGSGKSTQARLLAERRNALLTREPGGTDLGVRIREILLHADEYEVTARAEALLMAADRAHHVETKIKPALAAGTDVIGDRYVGSSLAYQGAGRELGLDPVTAINLFAIDGLRASLVLLIDVPVDVGRSRAGDRSQPDKLERERDGFHTRVREAYLALAEAHQDTWVVIDGTQSLDAVTADVNAAVAKHVGW